MPDTFNQNDPINIQAYGIDPRQFRQLQAIIGVKFSDQVPAYTPIGNRPEIVVYASGATYRLYAYIPTLDSWKSVAIA